MSMSQAEGDKIDFSAKCSAEEARIILLNNIRNCTFIEVSITESTLKNLDEKINVFNTDEKNISKINKYLNKIILKSIFNSSLDDDRISLY